MRVHKNQYVKWVVFGSWARYSGISFRVLKIVEIEKKLTNKNKQTKNKNKQTNKKNRKKKQKQKQKNKGI